jgi:hypothetical protein
MNVKEKLFQEVKTLCDGVGLNFENIGGELSDLVRDDEVLGYYASRGPFPAFSDTILDIFVLGKRCLYDYEWRQSGSVCEVLLFNSITEIAEAFSGEEDDFFSIYFLSVGDSRGLILQDKLEKKERLREFSRMVKNKLLESTA